MGDLSRMLAYSKTYHPQEHEDDRQRFVCTSVSSTASQKYLSRPAQSQETIVDVREVMPLAEGLESLSSFISLVHQGKETSK